MLLRTAANGTQVTSTLLKKTHCKPNTQSHSLMIFLCFQLESTHLFCTVMLCLALPYSIIFHSTPLHPTPSHPIPLYPNFILFHSIPFHSTPSDSTPLRYFILSKPTTQSQSLIIPFRSTPSIPFLSIPLHSILLHSSLFCSNNTVRYIILG